MRQRGRKPNLSFGELVKLRSIQAAFGTNSPEVEEFWNAKRKSLQLDHDRRLKTGKQTHEERQAVQRVASLRWYHEHKDDDTPEARARKETHAQASKDYYHRHKDDPEFKARQKANQKRYKEKIGKARQNAI